MVGERSKRSEAVVVRHGGVFRSENAGMSSEIPMRYRDAENPRFPPQCKSAEGESALRVSQLSWRSPMDKSLKFDYKI